ncbi:MAG TPA: response regulator [Verrucomicrobiae bacterium]|nr:response regulator [Verrucomicrobiae bacterium]
MNVKPRVLVVEDDPNVATVMEFLLAETGYECTIAPTGHDGIRCARREEFDLVILDINLPGLNGFDVCAWLKQDFRFQRTPIIFVSGRLNDDDRRRAFAFGADFIAKPFDAGYFTEKISARVRN